MTKADIIPYMQGTLVFIFVLHFSSSDKHRFTLPGAEYIYPATYKSGIFLFSVGWEFILTRHYLPH